MSDWVSKTAASGRFLTAAAQQPGETLIALDFDGTLASIVDDPDAARITPAAAAALARLGGRVRLAIITGRAVTTARRLGELDSLPGLEDVIVLGQYGEERWDARTGRQTPVERPAGIEAAWPEVVQAVEAAAAPGIHLEDKGRAIGIHTRRTADPEAALARLQPAVTEIAARHGLRLEPGRSVLELRTATSDKGQALMGLVAELGCTAVAMCGDDLGDLPAFDALARLAAGGVVTCAVVSVSAEQPGLAARADVAADGPDGVAAWLHAVADAIS